MRRPRGSSSQRPSDNESSELKQTVL
jgi:hypothetical protein